MRRYRNVLWALLVMAASIACSAIWPMGWALDYGPVNETPATPAPVVTVSGDAAQFMDTPRGKGLRPGVMLLNWQVDHGRRRSVAGLLT